MPIPYPVVGGVWPYGLSRVTRGRRRRREAGMEGEDEKNDDDEDWLILLGP
jgi:hypothetical protein